MGGFIESRFSRPRDAKGPGPKRRSATQIRWKSLNPALPAGPRTGVAGVGDRILYERQTARAAD